MKTYGIWILGMALLCGCASVDKSQRRSQAGIERGMDASAVRQALGEPSRVVANPSPTATDKEETWVYYADRPVLVPRWTYLPDPNGYWTPQYTPAHFSQRYVRTEVHFRNGQVVDLVEHAP